MKNKKCPYCRNYVGFGRKFSSHCGNCKKSPHYQKKIDRQRQAILSKRKDYIFRCPKCKKKFIINLTPNEYKNKIHRKYCSRKCANSRKQTKSMNEKRRVKLKKFDEETLKKRRQICQKLAGKKQRLKRRALKTQIYGSICWICKRKFPNMHLHRKDNTNHKDFSSMTNKEYEKEIKSKKYILLCYRCHKGIHFCTDILGLNWNQITRILSNIREHLYSSYTYLILAMRCL